MEPDPDVLRADPPRAGGLRPSHRGAVRRRARRHLPRARDDARRRSLIRRDRAGAGIAGRRRGCRDSGVPTAARAIRCARGRHAPAARRRRRRPRPASPPATFGESMGRRRRTSPRGTSWWSSACSPPTWSRCPGGAWRRSWWTRSRRGHTRPCSPARSASRWSRVRQGSCTASGTSRNCSSMARAAPLWYRRMREPAARSRHVWRPSTGR